MSWGKKLSCGLLCMCLCAAMAVATFGLSGCVNKLSSKNNDSLNLVIENVTVPDSGKLVYDITSLVDNVSYRSILLKRISRSDCRSYVQSLRSAGYNVEYEDAYSEGVYSFSTTYPKGVTLSGYWEENELSITVVDTAEFEAYQKKQEEQAKSGNQSGAGGSSESSSSSSE